MRISQTSNYNDPDEIRITLSRKRPICNNARTDIAIVTAVTKCNG